jgi:hypothetical protein
MLIPEFYPVETPFEDIRGHLRTFEDKGYYYINLRILEAKGHILMTY